MIEIKLSISNIAWEKNRDEEMYKYLKQNNIEGLEIAPTRILEESPYEKIGQAKEYSEQIKREYNLDIISMQSIWFGKTQNIFENDTNANELIEYTKKAIDFADTIGCTNLVFGCPKNRNIKDYDRDYEKAIQFFRQIGEYARNKNIVIAVEPNPTIYNTNFLNYTEEAIQFVKKVNLDSIKVNYDLGTVIYNEEDIKILEENIQYINHIHISEPNLALIEKRDLHKQLISILEKCNYDKYISIEMKKNDDIEKVKETIEYVKSILNK